MSRNRPHLPDSPEIDDDDAEPVLTKVQETVSIWLISFACHFRFMGFARGDDLLISHEAEFLKLSDHVRVQFFIR